MVKREVKKNNSYKETKNIISIVLGSFSIIAALLLPYFSGLIGCVGLILAYLEKGKSSIKLNKWAFILNMIAIVISIIILILVALAFAQIIQANSLL